MVENPTVKLSALCNSRTKVASCSSQLIFRLLYTDGSSHNKKVKFSRYRPGVAQRVSRGIALLFYDRGNKRG